jgi:hypothetical protein
MTLCLFSDPWLLPILKLWFSPTILRNTPRIVLIVVAPRANASFDWSDSVSSIAQISIDVATIQISTIA